ncbi:glycosyltransferase [Inmirania thermothiophila]|uniref:GT2 family glycosyltransferase n=1 Tax=Inmirania thermothiophila TaxID=1750597 RepID=A0A3N1XSK5_9GAMM|nr:glycosyltransferase family A protein [Inmirania thermothiophila]ROR29625.1 GT2 family glycosyltransferase [Inmirania thermothiophila]
MDPQSEEDDNLMPLLVSVIIPTYNRARLIGTAVRHVLAQKGAPPYEVIVVDNGSADDTPAVLNALAASDGRLRVLRELVQGISAARNAGVRAARGEYLFFTDDDVRVPEDWIATGMRHFETRRCDALGGPVLPDIDHTASLPSWFGDFLYPCLALRPPEGDARLLTENDWMPYGANMAFRREALLSAGGFDPRLGRLGNFLGLGEESALFRRILAQGGKVLFIPDAPVRHYIPPERLRRRYFRRWHFDSATQRGWHLAAEEGLRPRPWMLRVAARSFAKSLRLKLARHPEASFRAELRGWEHLGIFRGTWTAAYGRKEGGT